MNKNKYAVLTVEYTSHGMRYVSGIKNNIIELSKIFCYTLEEAKEVTADKKSCQIVKLVP